MGKAGLTHGKPRAPDDNTGSAVKPGEDKKRNRHGLELMGPDMMCGMMYKIRLLKNAWQVFQKTRETVLASRKLLNCGIERFAYYPNQMWTWYGGRIVSFGINSLNELGQVNPSL